LDFKKSFQESRDYPLLLLKHECSKLGLDFVIHYGIRACLYNGNFFGLTTQAEWDFLVQKEKMLNYARSHFLKEIQFMTCHNMKYVIRSKGLADNAFLKKLAEVEMCNGIGIYTKNQYGVVSYFFNAKHDNNEALQFFVNQIHVFQLIVDIVEKKLAIEGYWKKRMILDKPQCCLNTDDRRLIFYNKNFLAIVKNQIFFGQNNIPLTRRESQIIDLLTTGSTTKDMASFFNVGIRTIESHLRALRKKGGVNKTRNLINVPFGDIKYKDQ